MMEETITFELIRRIQREEQRVPKLTKLPENFYNSLSAYLEQKRSLIKEDRKTALEIKNIERLIEDIFNRRERKILNSAIIAARTNIPSENLTDEEKEFFDKIVAWIKDRRNEGLKKMLSGEKEELATLIVFKEETPEFVGIDEKTYGPFKKGDIAKLPEENMKVLIERGIVEEFKVSK
jgi:DNA replication initiation complex subunit (GINS family)